MPDARKWLVGLVLATAVGSDAIGEATTTVVDVPTRGATQRFLYTRPDDPVANLVFVPGNDGILGIKNDGTMPTLTGRCAPIGRNRDAFAARRIAVALVDQTSDGQIRQYVDIREVVRYVRARDNVPTWIIGGSASTTAVLNFAIEFPLDQPLGVVLFSAATPYASLAAAVKRPTLLIFHVEDAPLIPFVEALFDALVAAPDKKRVGLTGGTNEDCGGHHLFMGIDAEFVDTVAGFIARHNTMRR